MTSDQVVNRRERQPACQQIEGCAGHTQRRLLELRARRLRVLTDADDHGKNPHPRHDLDERIHPKAKERQRFIGDSEKDRDKSLQQVLPNRKNSQP